MAHRFIQISVIYLTIGAALGLYMGIKEDFLLHPVHAHLLLAGWLSLAMAGVIYHLYPSAARTRLAMAHFWLHNLGLPVFMVSLALLLTGREGLVQTVAAGGTMLLAGLVLFAVNVLLYAKGA